ncbi:hypothetical protein H6F93_01800 [Leptolyngbya sp. FACHB-671]|nr:hypothetical protein [Leptolyngbya sp. FACHB-671]
MQGMMVAATIGGLGMGAVTTIGVCVGVSATPMAWQNAKPIYLGFGAGLILGVAALTLTLLHYRSLIADYYNQKVNYDLHPYCTNPSHPRVSTTATPTTPTSTTSPTLPAVYPQL